jgi:hypothetical protein
MRAAATAIEQHWHNMTNLDLSFTAKKGESLDMRPLAAVAVHMPHLQTLTLDDTEKNLAGLAPAAISWPLLTK